MTTFLFAVLPVLVGAPAEATQSLAGEWLVALDPADFGQARGWFGRPLDGGRPILLPGSLELAGIGDADIPSAGFAHLTRTRTYTGAAWYQRTVNFPAAWRGRRLELFLERAHQATAAWLDGRPLGQRDSLSVPHRYDLGVGLAPGDHRLTVRVDNRMIHNVGGWAHSVTDETQTNWNGLIGRLELRAGPPVWLEAVRVAAGADRRAHLTVRVANVTGTHQRRRLRIAAAERSPFDEQILCPPEGSTLERTVAFSPAERLWDEFDPALQRLEVILGEGDETSRATVSFGLRTIGATPDRRLALNGRPIFLRGTLECCIFPRTGFPPTDRAAWDRIVAICRSYGLNHLRFHSWCPPEAAFEAANAAGFLLQVEGPFWVGDWGADAARDAWAREELERIQDAYGHHPSFALFSIGNEPGGDLAVIHALSAHLRQRDRRMLTVAGTGWGQSDEDDFTVTPVRGVRGPSTDWDFAERIAERRVPAISHEIGQWCVFPNLAEIPKYDGITRARNFEMILADLRAKGFADLAPAFTRASGQLSALLYKEEIELLLRTRGHSGFQLLDLHDFPGQHTSTVGLLDAFWETKGLIAPEEFRRFCAPTVPLARFGKRVWTTAERFSARLELAHFGPRDLPATPTAWALRTADGATVAAGELPPVAAPTGDVTRLGAIDLPLAQAPAPAALRLSVWLPGTDAANDWSLWVYPPEAPPEPAGVRLERSWPAARAALAAGQRVLFAPPARSLLNSARIRFATVFWNPIMFRQIDSMGLLIDPDHPAVAGFPTAEHSDWQWWELTEGGRALDLAAAPAAFRPTVWAVDSFHRNRRLGVLFEARVGPGRLLATTLNLDAGPAARTLRASLLAYAASDRFAPPHELTAEVCDVLFTPSPSLLAMVPEATVTADSQAPGFEAERAIDGDPDTLWHTRWQPAPDPPPHWLLIDLGRPRPFAGFAYVPRQDMVNGRLGDWEVFAGDDPANLGEPVARGRFADGTERQVVRFAAPVTARYLKLVGQADLAGQPFNAVAELELLAPP